MEQKETYIFETPNGETVRILGVQEFFSLITIHYFRFRLKTELLQIENDKMRNGYIESAKSLENGIANIHMLQT